MTPIQTFCRQWSEWLWKTMSNTGHGYKRHSLRNSGKGKDRRADKLGPEGRPMVYTTTHDDEIFGTYTKDRPERKLERKVRLGDMYQR